MIVFESSSLWRDAVHIFICRGNQILQERNIQTSVLKDYFQNDSFLIWTLKLKQYIINSNIIVEDPNDFCITFCDFIIEPENLFDH